MLLSTFLHPVQVRCMLCLGSGGSATAGRGSGSVTASQLPAQQDLSLLVATIPWSPGQEAKSRIWDTPQGSPCGRRGLELSMASPRAVFSSLQFFHELDMEYNGRLATICQFLMKIIGKITPLQHFSLGQYVLFHFPLKTPFNRIVPIEGLF